MNPNDAPLVPNAMGNSYARRIRCVRLKSRFTFSEDAVDNDAQIYLADDMLKEWLATGEAASIFWTTALIPFIRRHSKEECERIIQVPSRSIQEDSQWVRQKMARLPTTIGNGCAKGGTPFLPSFRHGN